MPPFTDRSRDIEVDFELLSTPSAPSQKALVTLFRDADECEGVVLRG